MFAKSLAWLLLAALATSCTQDASAVACADCSADAELAAGCESCSGDAALADVAAACCEDELNAPGPDGADELAALAPVDDGSTTLSLDELMGGGADAPARVDDGTGLPNHGALPEFSLVSDAGVDFDLASMRGDVWVVDFIFTRCAGPCPQMSSTFADLVRDELPARLLSVTVDPGFDSPKVLSDYRTDWEVEADRWTLLTGSREGVRELAENGFKLPVNTSADETVDGMGPLFHSGKFALVDAEGRVRGYYDYRDALELEKLARDAAALKAVAH